MKKILSLMFYSLSFLLAADTNDGISFGADILEHFKSNMNTTINDPITNGSAITSVDGKSSGSAKIVCEEAKSADFISFSYDIDSRSNIKIGIAIDENLDKIKDRNFYFSNVSGICANGVVTTTSVKQKVGNDVFGHPKYIWVDKVAYHIWQYNGSILSLKEVQREDSGGCYCINQNCGNLAHTNKAKILQDISAPISNLIASSTHFILSKAELKNNTLVYKGQDSSACDTALNKGASYVQTNTNSDLKTLANQQKNLQAQSEDSVYSAFTGAFNNDNSGLDTSFKQELMSKETSIKSSATMSGSNYSYNGISGSIQLANNPDIKFCEVSVPSTDTTIFSDGTNRKNMTSNDIIYKAEIRECKQDICPIKQNEKIKHKCGKINDMGEVLASFSVVEEISKDSVCHK